MKNSLEYLIGYACTDYYKPKAKRMIIINPGSQHKGGTFEQALKNAQRWLKNIHVQGWPDVTMTTDEKVTEPGRWEFHFRHPVTGKMAVLHVHGFTDEECDKFLFRPREYWNGSSSGIPKPEDWLTEEYTWRYVYEKKLDTEKHLPCKKCEQRPAVKDYNGHGYHVCELCYDSLSREFDEEYR